MLAKKTCFCHISELKNLKGLCRLCGRKLPPPNLYSSDRCWICWRATAELEYSRHYYQGTKGYWEEATELAGVCPFLEKNKALIRIVYRKYEPKLKN